MVIFYYLKERTHVDVLQIRTHHNEKYSHQFFEINLET